MRTDLDLVNDLLPYFVLFLYGVLACDLELGIEVRQIDDLGLFLIELLVDVIELELGRDVSYFHDVI